MPSPSQTGGLLENCIFHLVAEECCSFAVIFLLQGPVRVEIILEFQKQSEFSISSSFHLFELNIFPLVHGDRADKTAGSAEETITM